MKSFAKSFAALIACAALAFGMVACSNASGGNGENQNTTPNAYNLIIDGRIANGTVIASTPSANPASKAVAGDTVTLIIKADSGYELDSISVVAANGFVPQLSVLGTNKRTFVMPKQIVTVKALFKTIAPGNYSIVASDSVAGGSVTASPASGAAGTVITLTATPKTNCYALDSFTVLDSNSNPVTVDANGKFTMPEGGVTVTATFKTVPPSSPYTSAGSQEIESETYELVTFGSWPQTIKAATVDVNDQCESKTVGEFTYYMGSDGYWYAKLSDKYYKVEPIKWRVLTTSYNKIEGRKLLLAESVLIGKRFDDDSNNYQNSEIRKWLNSNASSGTKSDCVGTGGFLRTAFSIAERGKIALSTVDNSVSSTLPLDYQFDNDDNRKNVWNDGVNPNASDTSTTDKVFLLSEREVSTTSYGFKLSWSSGVGNSRIRQATDYAKASGADQSATAGYGCFWWLRSPYHTGSTAMKYVAAAGRAYEGYMWAYTSDFGIVPALCVEN